MGASAKGVAAAATGNGSPTTQTPAQKSSRATTARVFPLSRTHSQRTPTLVPRRGRKSPARALRFRMAANASHTPQSATTRKRRLQPRSPWGRRSRTTRRIQSHTSREAGRDKSRSGKHNGHQARSEGHHGSFRAGEDGAKGRREERWQKGRNEKGQWVWWVLRRHVNGVAVILYTECKKGLEHHAQNSLQRAKSSWLYSQYNVFKLFSSEYHAPYGCHGTVLLKVALHISSRGSERVRN